MADVPDHEGIALVKESMEIFTEVIREMQVAVDAGWTRQHDDEHGSGHLVTEAVDRLTHMGEYPTDDAVDFTLIVAIGLLVNAKRTLARARTVGTFTVEASEPEVVHLILSPAAARTMCDLRALDVTTTESLGTFTCPDCRKRALAELV